MSTWKLVAPSAAKVEANRANAQHSTGPRTERGKDTASRNAATHGLTSKKLILDSEEREAFARLRERLAKRYRPAGEVEQNLLEQFAEAEWRLARCRSVETAMFDECIAELITANPELSPDQAMARLFTDETYMKRMRLFLRYQSAIERAHAKAQRELEAEIAARREAETDTESAVGFVSQPHTGSLPSHSPIHVKPSRDCEGAVPSPAPLS